MSHISDILGYHNPFWEYDGFTNRTPDEGRTLTNRSWKITSSELVKYIDSGEVSRKKFFTYLDNNPNSSKFSDGDKLLYYTYVYTSIDPIKLVKIQKSIEAKDDEILIFIEDNTGDTSTQKHYLKIGKKLRTKLEKNSNYVKYSEKTFKKFGIGDNDDFSQINELIKESVAEFDTFDKIWFAIKVVTFINLNTTISAISTIATELRKLKREDKHWNPKSGELKGEKFFTPYFFPIVKLDLKTDRFLLGLNNQYVDLNQLIDELHNNIESKLTQTKQQLDKETPEYLKYIDSLDLRKLPLTITKYFLETVKSIVQFVNDFVAEGILFYNALLCGFINSIIEIIVGFFELFNLILKGINGLLFGSNLDEYYDNFIQALAKVDFKKVFGELTELAKELFPRLLKSFGNKILNISFEEVGYYIGYLIGLVLEFILTSGIGSVKSIIAKSTKTVSKLFDIIIEFVESIISKGTSKTDKIQSLIEFFGKGTDDVLEAIKRLRKELNKFFDEGALKHLDDIEIKAYQKQKRTIDEVESGKRKIDPGEKEGAQRKEGDYTLSGNYGEMKMDDHMLTRERRYKPLHNLIDDLDKKYPPGIDGVYENLDFTPPPPPAKYIVAESKYSQNGTVGLSTRKTKDGLQMSERWIRKRLRKMLPKDKFRDFYKTYTTKNNEDVFAFDSVLFKINKDGVVKSFKLSYEKNPKLLKEINL